MVCAWVLGMGRRKADILDLVLVMYTECFRLKLGYFGINFATGDTHSLSIQIKSACLTFTGYF